jgi:hypothetical protein
MLETWEKLFRQVALKANLLKASVAADLETAYTQVAIGAAEMQDRGVQFPKTAVDDALLAAGDKVARRIAANPASRYRRDLADVTANITSGDVIPSVGASGDPIIGKIGVVKDGTDGKALEWVTRQQIHTYLKITLKQSLYFYHDDGIRLWHTRPTTNVKADVVVWSKATQRARLEANPRGACPFSEDLHEALVSGALSVLFRSSNNTEQADLWKARFDQSLEEIFVEVKEDGSI